MSVNVIEFIGGPRDGEVFEGDPFLLNEIIFPGLNPEYNPFDCLWDHNNVQVQGPPKYLEGVYRIYCTTLDRSFAQWQGYR